MDTLIDFSSKYTEIENENVLCDGFSDDTENHVGEITPKNNICVSSDISTPMMFSRQSSLDSLSTISWDGDGYSLHSDYSYQSSSIVSPSEIPDSPSDFIPPPPIRSNNSDIISQNKSRSQPNDTYFVEAGRIEDDGSISRDNENHEKLLENCLQLGIRAILSQNNRRQSMEVNVISPKDEYSDLTHSDEALLEKCWMNGIKAFKFRRNAWEDE